MVAVGIHSNLCLLEPVNWYSYLYLDPCEHGLTLLFVFFCLSVSHIYAVHCVSMV